MGRSNTITVTVTERTKFDTNLTIELNRTSGSPGTVVLSGVLSAPSEGIYLAGKIVKLYVNGVYKQSKVTGSLTGSYVFSYPVGVGDYRFQTNFEGDADFNLDYSYNVFGTYALIDTSFYGFDINPMAASAPVTLTIMAQLRRDDTGLGLSGKSVELWRNKDGGSFTKIKTTTTKSTSGGPGFALFNDTLTVIGEYGYYPYIAGDSQLVRCEVAYCSAALEAEKRRTGDDLPVPGATGFGLAMLQCPTLVSQE